MVPIKPSQTDGLFAQLNVLPFVCRTVTAFLYYLLLILSANWQFMFWNLKRSASACPNIVFVLTREVKSENHWENQILKTKPPNMFGHVYCIQLVPKHVRRVDGIIRITFYVEQHPGEMKHLPHRMSNCDHASSKTTSGKSSSNKGSKRECMGPLALFLRNRKQQTSDASLQCGAPWQNPNLNMHVLNLFNKAAVNNTNLELWIEHGSAWSNIIRHMQPVNKRWCLGRAPFDYGGNSLYSISLTNLKCETHVGSMGAFRTWHYGGFWYGRG